jgi:hypothetical protein
MKFYSFFLLMLTLCVSGCSKKEEKLLHALEMAGKNRNNLEKVLEHYESTDNEKLKYEAARFLIENMDNKGAFTYALVDEYMRPYDFDIFKYGNHIAMREAKKKFEDSIGKQLQYRLTGFLPDLEIMTASYLINHIDQSFEAWKMPTASHLDFNAFCEAILPYRINNEPLHIVPDDIWSNIETYRGLGKKINDPVALCTMINKEMEKKYAWRHKETELYPGLLTIDEIQKIKGGRCDDLNVLLSMVLRYSGVPVYAEFTPFLGNRNSGGHSWLSVLNKQKVAIPFNALYDHPELGKWPFGDSRVAKSYRRYFNADCNTPGKHKPAVFFGIFLDDPRIRDNTAELIETFDYQIFKTDFPPDTKEVYLGILNGKEWQVIAKSTDSLEYFNFKNLGKDIFYQPFTFREGEKYYGSRPFMQRSGKEYVEYFDNEQVVENELKIKTYWWLRHEREYQLYAWQDLQWKPLYHPLNYDGGWNTAGDEELMIVNDSITAKVPAQTILRFEDNLKDDQKDIGSFTRPFILENNTYLKF